MRGSKRVLAYLCLQILLQNKTVGLYILKDTRITSTFQLKDVNENADYYLPVQSLVERYGLVWLASPDTFAPDAPIAEADFRIFFTDAFGASFETPGKGFLTRGNFIIYTAAWARNFIAKIEKKVKEDNQ